MTPNSNLEPTLTLPLLTLLTSAWEYNCVGLDVNVRTSVALAKRIEAADMPRNVCYVEYLPGKDYAVVWRKDAWNSSYAKHLKKVRAYEERLLAMERRENLVQGLIVGIRATPLGGMLDALIVERLALKIIEENRVEQARGYGVEL